ncbi:MAG: O-antigen ligase family protein [Candidatus Dormibacteraceae bacterium]
MAPRRVEPHSRWWLHGATVLVMAYVIASQVLLDVGGWSLVGFAVAVLLAALLGFGRLFGIYKFSAGRWLYLPGLFVFYCAMRGLLGSKYSQPLGVLEMLASGYLGGAGVAAALLAGVRFRALVYAQMLSNLCQIAAVLFVFGDAPLAGENGVRYAGLTGNANEFGLQLALGACLIWLLPKKSGVLACLFAFGAVAFALMTSWSRQVLLVVPFFLALVLIAAFSTRNKRRRLIVGGFVVALGVLGVSLAPVLEERASEIAAIQRAVDYKDESSYLTRYNMVQKALSLWEEAPLLGNGVDAFHSLSGYQTYAHNNYVELLCDLGLVGVFLFYAIHVNIVLGASRVRGPLRLCCLLFVLLLVCLDTGSVGYKRKPTVMVLMILGAIASRSQLVTRGAESLAGRRGFGSRSISQDTSCPLASQARNGHPDPKQRGERWAAFE